MIKKLDEFALNKKELVQFFLIELKYERDKRVLEIFHSDKLSLLPDISANSHNLLKFAIAMSRLTNVKTVLEIYHDSRMGEHLERLYQNANEIMDCAIISKNEDIALMLFQELKPYLSASKQSFQSMVCVDRPNLAKHYIDYFYQDKKKYVNLLMNSKWTILEASSGLYRPELLEHLIENNKVISLLKTHSKKLDNALITMSALGEYENFEAYFQALPHSFLSEEKKLFLHEQILLIDDMKYPKSNNSQYILSLLESHLNDSALHTYYENSQRLIKILPVLLLKKEWYSFENLRQWTSSTLLNEVMNEVFPNLCVNHYAQVNLILKILHDCDISENTLIQATNTINEVKEKNILSEQTNKELEEILQALVIAPQKKHLEKLLPIALSENKFKKRKI